LAGEWPNIRLYEVKLYCSSQPYKCVSTFLVCCRFGATIKT
jgi:hypothetical protein